MKLAYFVVFIALALCACGKETVETVVVDVSLTHGVDESAGGGDAYIITTPTATYYLEKQGGGLSSMLDKDGVDWIGFHKKEGSGFKGEYRGFPNAVHKQDGSYFHALNTGTDQSTSVVTKETQQHVQIVFTSGNGQWQGQYDFYLDRCDFTMTKVSEGFKYWVQYEGVPGGKKNKKDYWYNSASSVKTPIDQPFEGDLPHPEWYAFGDKKSPRVLYMLHHEDDNHPDNYMSRSHMTVLGFGRSFKEKFIDQPNRFSIGFIESTDYQAIDQAMKKIVN